MPGFTLPQEGPRRKWALYDYAMFADADADYAELNQLCMPEDWDFMDREGSERHLLLRGYVENTFMRLQAEGKVVEHGESAAFNTGLVDRDHNDVFAYMTRRHGGKGGPAWRFKGFCCDNGSDIYRKLRNVFDPLPRRAEYLKSVEDVVFDTGRALDVNYGHIIGERLHRFPVPFLRDVFSGNPDAAHVLDRAEDAGGQAEREEVLGELSPHLTQEAFARAKVRIDRARMDVLRRVRLDYTVAVPAYYPTLDAMQFMLPLYLDGGDAPGAVLVVRAGKGRNAGRYDAHTVYTPSAAYLNARLVTMPSESWLCAVAPRPAAGAGESIGATPTMDQLVAGDIGAPHARLSGREIDVDVFSGTTVGCRRDPSRAFPDISLSMGGGEYAGVSQVHGVFEHDGGKWFYTSRGSNGTALSRDGETMQLGTNVPVQLADGDDLVLAGSPPLRFSTAGADIGNAGITPVVVGKAQGGAGAQRPPRAWLKVRLVDFELSDGCTVGRVRSGEGTLPDVILPASDEAYGYASQLHGHFGFSGGRWMYTSMGRNGTRVRRGGELTVLEKGVPFALEDGDELSFGKSPYSRFTTRRR